MSGAVFEGDAGLDARREGLRLLLHLADESLGQIPGCWVGREDGLDAHWALDNAEKRGLATGIGAEA